MKITNPEIQRFFSQAYILGGSPCSGKSTIAERLSHQFNLQYYKVDDYEKEHANRCRSESHPVMYKYSKMSWNEIWMRPVSLQVQEEFEYYRERFEMIIEDLEKYDSNKPMILEGAAYLPELLELNNANPKRVVFLVSTKEFQLRHYVQRGWIQHILKECEDPKEAFDNWMMRDHLFGQEMLNQAKVRNYETILVDGKQNINEHYEKVRAFFGLK